MPLKKQDLRNKTERKNFQIVLDFSDTLTGMVAYNTLLHDQIVLHLFHELVPPKSHINIGIACV
jgi:hypothetical protein